MGTGESTYQSIFKGHYKWRRDRRWPLPPRWHLLCWGRAAHPRVTIEFREFKGGLYQPSIGNMMCPTLGAAKAVVERLMDDIYIVHNVRERVSRRDPQAAAEVCD